MLVLSKVEIEGSQLITNQSFHPSRKGSGKTDVSATSERKLLGPTKRTKESLTRNMALLLKFGSIIAENSNVQFSILIHVA